MKKLIVLILAICITFAGCAPAMTPAATPAISPKTQGNFSDDMKIPHVEDISPEDGADSVERNGDHKDSPYYNTLDFYNMKSNDTLTILSNFKTQQQTSEWSCGVTSGLMVLNWYDKLGDYNEKTLAEFRSNKLTPEATSLKQLIEVFNGVGGFDLYSTFDCVDTASDVFTFDFIKENLLNNTPIIVGWNDWGGHWQVIIGYDDMGTETTQDDVIIVADSYDTTDHNQDGYGIYGAERFIYNFTFYDFFEEEDLNDTVFLVAKPKA